MDRSEICAVFWAVRKAMLKGANSEIRRLNKDAWDEPYAPDERPRDFQTWGEDGDGVGAAVAGCMGVNFISAWRALGHHRDPESEQWSHLLVLRKHPKDFVDAPGQKLPFNQPPGTLLVLNVWDYHALVRTYDYPALWTAAVIDEDERLPEAKVWEMFEEQAQAVLQRMKAAA